jgi:hypothetical protein
VDLNIDKFKLEMCEQFRMRDLGLLSYLGIEVCLLVAGLLLSLRKRMTLGIGVIFWFISHTMPCQPEGLGLHIYSWPRQPSIC